MQRTKRLQELRQRTRIKDKQDKDRKEAQKTQSLALLMRQGTRATTSHALRSRQAEASARLGQLRSTTSPKVPAQRQADQAAASQQRQRIAQQKVQEFRKRKSEEALKKAKLDQPRKGQLLLAGPGKDRRAAPGTASHSGELPRIKAGETWLKGQGTAGKVPLQIAEKMQGRQFTNFDHFRREFWKEVHKDKALRAQFSVGNQQRMAAGKAPFAPKNQQVGKRQRYELDHVQELRKGGNVYDMNNLFIRSPLNHIKGK
ncbi:hypothetical protein [Roseobacter sinensis]|uniref:HNH endonuclease n=1 Tax=Roseobacter sinensis TaxID=2931391 RepID=A0ABT3BIR8_9RHOB|nr:hypothetical protein [Roseobacter sp. WL0113]MCV3273462.1 hypothetical protein [Roseobacter sp. WL0113]